MAALGCVPRGRVVQEVTVADTNDIRRPAVVAAACDDIRSRTPARHGLHDRAGAPPRPSVIGDEGGQSVAGGVDVELPVGLDDGRRIVHPGLAIEGKRRRHEQEHRCGNTAGFHEDSTIVFSELGNEACGYQWVSEPSGRRWVTPGAASVMASMKVSCFSSMLTPSPGRSFGHTLPFLHSRNSGMYGTGRSPWLYSIEHLARERHHRLHVTGGRDRTGEMRHDADFVGIAHRHDLEHFRDAADVGQRRAGEIDVALLDERTELRPCPPLLARRQRHGRQQPQLRESASGTAPREPGLRRRTAATVP